MRKLYLMLLGTLLPLALMAQHSITTQSGEVLRVKITEIGDSTLTYSFKEGKKEFVKTIPMSEVANYTLTDDVRYVVSQPHQDTIVVRDTIIQMIADERIEEIVEYLSIPNQTVGKALKKSGTISLSIGVPCVAAGIASLLYAELIPNPTAGYTTSKELAAQDPNLQYMSAETYISQMEQFNSKVKTAENIGYICTGAGAALTVVGIPLYCYGNHLMKLKVNYIGNGASVTINF